jgi:ring-1,2-phenylacetyl-CoA epoxidase subunit PaaC
VSRELFDYVVALGDDALVMSQRLGWWISRAPELEEDLALANIGLDQLGQARMLLTYAGAVEDAGRGEDELAYQRPPGEFRNVCLVERPMEDFGIAMARLWLFAAYQHGLYTALCASSDPTLAAIAAKAIKEVGYHLDHAEHWVVRLGDGTAESHRRMQAAVDEEWPWAGALFDAAWPAPSLVRAGIAVEPAALQGPVLARARRVLHQATLGLPDPAAAAARAGRSGPHTEHLRPLIEELQSVARAHPGVVW